MNSGTIILQADVRDAIAASWQASRRSASAVRLCDPALADSYAAGLRCGLATVATMFGLNAAQVLAEPKR